MLIEDIIKQEADQAESATTTNNSENTPIMNDGEGEGTENSASNPPRVSHGQTRTGEVSEAKKQKTYPPVLTDNRETIIAALRKRTYMIDIAAQYNLPRHVVESYIHGDPELEQAYQDGVEGMTDAVEKRLMDMAFAEQEFVQNDQGENLPTRDGRIMSINLNAVKFYLERKAANRGYGAKLETNEVGNGRGTVVPIIVMGSVAESAIDAAEAEVARVNAEGLIGLEGVVPTDGYALPGATPFPDRAEDMGGAAQ